MPSELDYGRELLIDSGADSGVAGKHAHITKIIEGVYASAKYVGDNLPIQEHISIVNVLYAYNHLDNSEI